MMYFINLVNSFRFFSLYLWLILYAIFLPFAFLTILLIARFKNKIDDPNFENHFGILYFCYKKDKFWYYSAHTSINEIRYESFAILRRTMILTIVYTSLAYLHNYVGLVYILVAIFLLFLLVIHILLKPYKLQSENVAEATSYIELIIGMINVMY